MDSGFRVPSRWVVVLSFLGAAGCAATVVPFHPNVPEGGRAISVSVRPDDDNRVLVASETGGSSAPPTAERRGGTWTAFRAHASGTSPIRQRIRTW